MKKDTTFVLLFLAVWLGAILWLNGSETSLSDLWNAATALMPNTLMSIVTDWLTSWWFAGLSIGLLIAAVPFAAGWAFDGKGQGASGWFLMFAAIASAVLASLFLLTYFGATIIYMLGSLFFE